MKPTKEQIEGKNVDGGAVTVPIATPARKRPLDMALESESKKPANHAEPIAESVCEPGAHSQQDATNPEKHNNEDATCTTRKAWMALLH